MLLSFFGAKIQKHSIVSKEVFVSKQGRPPRESEKGAVRCGRRAMRGHHPVPLFTTAANYATFWTLVYEIHYSGKLCYF